MCSNPMYVRSSFVVPNLSRPRFRKFKLRVKVSCGNVKASAECSTVFAALDKTTKEVRSLKST